MEVYKNVNGNSGITHYEIEADYVAVKFTECLTFIFIQALVFPVSISKE
jgi:hypothetical protein